jgi:hypothetical protein
MHQVPHLLRPWQKDKWRVISKQWHDHVRLSDFPTFPVVATRRGLIPIGGLDGNVDRLCTMPQQFFLTQSFLSDSAIPPPLSNFHA